MISDRTVLEMVSSPFCSLLSICDYQLGSCTVRQIGSFIVGLLLGLAFMPRLIYICCLAAVAFITVAIHLKATKRASRTQLDN